MKTHKFRTANNGLVELEVTENGVVERIMQEDPYVRLYPYRYDNKLQSWILQENVKLSTLKSGLNRGNWRLA